MRDFKLGGYKTGSHEELICSICFNKFKGHKTSTLCLPCAVDDANELITTLLRSGKERPETKPLNKINSLKESDKHSENRTVVRLSKSIWQDSRSRLHFQSTLHPLKRKSEGYNHLEDLMNWIDPDSFGKLINNLDKSAPGVYELVVTDIYKDWETGIIEDWCYKLVPYTEPETSNQSSKKETSKRGSLKHATEKR